MLFRVFTSLLGCMLTVQCRDTGRTLKSIPTITSSLVNLGKMEINFHFNTKDLPARMDNKNTPLNSVFFPKSEPITEEPCPCSSLRTLNNYPNQPTDLLSKVLMSNDLFTSKDPLSSTMCCGSHEHAQEDIVTFEFGPKGLSPNSNNPVSNVPGLPFILDTLLPKKTFMSPISTKSKAVEIFLYPKKKDSLFYPFKNQISKDTIQVVGDKELSNDFKSLKLRPSLPINLQSSVKKDLTAQERNVEMKQPDKEETEVTSTTTGNPNAI